MIESISLRDGAKLIYEKEASTRDKVNELEVMMKTAITIGVRKEANLEVKHYFANGVYARELYIPAGVILTGKIHKYENMNVMTKGVMDVLVDDKIQRVWAPFIVVSPPGTKRIARAIEDTIWITFHSVDTKDIDLIEKHFVCDNEQQYLEFVADQQLKLPLVE